MRKLLLLAFSAVGIASADLIPVLINAGAVTCAAGGGGFTECTYDYTVTVHDSAMLTAATPHPEFFTIYDFEGFTGNVTTPDGWVFNSAALGTTPSNILANFDTAIPNLTWTYVGSTDVMGGTTITGFSAKSIYGPNVKQGYFASEATHASISPGDSWVQNVGFTDVPVPQLPPGDETVPEPATMGVLGISLTALGLLRRKLVK